MKSINSKAISDLIEMMNDTPTCLVLISYDGNIIQINESGKSLLDTTTTDQLVGRTIFDFIGKDHLKSFIAFNQKVCKGKKSSMVVKVRTIKGRERWMEAYSIPYLINEEKAQLSLFHDIDEKVKVKEELIKKDEALLEARRLSSLGEFASGVAHEINNPLTIIKSTTGLLLQQQMKVNPNDKIAVESLKNIIETVDRTSNIITNLRKLSVQSGDKVTTNLLTLYPIIEDTLSVCRQKFTNASIHIENQVNKTLKAHCRAVELSQVLMNLFNNSFSALYNHKAAWVRLESKKIKDKVQLLITDSGNGIDPKIAKKIMQPFFTTKEVGEGTGLGLSISSSIMESLGGRIFLNTSHEKTQFILEFKA